MRIEESGRFAVATSPGDVLGYLADPEALPRCLPAEVREVGDRDDGGVSVDLRAHHAGTSEDLRLRLYVTDVDESAGRVAYAGHAIGSRVKADLDGEFVLAATNDGTDVEWTGAADVGGLLSSLNRGVAGAVVREKLAETADNVRLALEERA